MRESGGFLLSYFLAEDDADGEQVRFALSEGPTPESFTPLNGGRPVLPCTLGEGGVRDPFLLRDERRGCFVLLGTDLRIGAGGDWARAIRTGSAAIMVWESADLLTWTGPVRRRLSAPEAGNTWAPKAFWSEPRGLWLVFWASALYPAGADRTGGSYQRMMVAPTRDFRSFGPPEVYLDAGHDVIDATFLPDGDRVYRFSANARPAEGPPSRHLFQEVGRSLEDPAFRPVAVDVGRDAMVCAEGPAVAADPGGGHWYLLADEFGLRGYQLFRTQDLASGVWEHLAHARLPDGARHGSLLPLSAQERAQLLAKDDWA